jgi:hypothetical protein
LSAWLSDVFLDDSAIKVTVQSLENTLGDVAPLNQLGYHLLFEAVRPDVPENS